MIHYSCDLCKCELDPKQDSSYVVRMEVYPAANDADLAIDNDRDHLEDIQEVLERYDEFEADGLLPESDTFRKLRLDLCSGCCEGFLQFSDGRRLAAQFDFSKR